MTRRREPLAHSIIFFFSDFVQVLLRRLQQGESQSLKCVRELLYPHADGTLLLWPYIWLNCCCCRTQNAVAATALTQNELKESNVCLHNCDIPL